MMMMMITDDRTANHVAVFSLPRDRFACRLFSPPSSELSRSEHLNLATTLLRILTDHNPTGNSLNYFPSGCQAAEQSSIPPVFCYPIRQRLVARVEVSCVRAVSPRQSRHTTTCAAVPLCHNMPTRIAIVA
jgi:hypothetical protein